MEKMKKKYELMKYSKPAIYTSLVLLVVMSIFGIGNIISTPKENENSIQYVSDSIFDNTILVNGSNEKEKQKFLKPFNDEKVVLSHNFYDHKSKDESQLNSIIYYEDTYIQNSGVDYDSKEEFDVIASFDGTVVNISTDAILGKTIEIKHNDNLITIYQGVDNIKVKKDQNVKAGEKLAKSSTTNIYKDNKQSLHYEVYYKGEIINPTTFFDKTLKEIESGK
ncbi:MAG: peptidoglycan DD-metalloendopeptidase family protein [Bacilli bacterium]